MLLCLEAHAKQGSLLSKTFPLLVLQSQDANTKLAGWDFRRFCTYLRKQRCYHKAAEKNYIDDFVVWKICIISKGIQQGQVPPWPCGTPWGGLMGLSPNIAGVTLTGQGQRHYWGLPCLIYAVLSLGITKIIHCRTSWC